MNEEAKVIDVEYKDVNSELTENDIPTAVPEQESIPDLKSTNEIKAKKIKDSGLKISDEEALELIKLITEFHQNKVTDVYSRLPKELKKMVDSYTNTTNNIRGKKGIVMKNNAAKALLNMLIHNLGFTESFNKMQEEIHDEINKTTNEIRDLLNDAYQKAFNNLDQIRQEDPERAAKIESVRDGFEQADKFNELIIEFLKNVKPKELKRYKQHYNDALVEFKKHTANNNLGVRIPNMDNLYLSMFRNKKYAAYGTDVLKTFIVLLCKFCSSYDIAELKKLAFVYRTIGNVYQFGLTPQQKDMQSDKITLVLDYISNIINTTKDKKKGK